MRDRCDIANYTTFSDDVLLLRHLCDLCF